MKYEVKLTDEQAREYVSFFRDKHPVTPCGEAMGLLADAIRANPPKPRRMHEPGWGEKVIAHWDAYPSKPREVWLRTCAGWENGSGLQIRWDALADPEPWTAES